MDEIISSKSIEHDKQTLVNYPGDEGLETEAESFKKVAVPRLAATMQAIRKRIEIPFNAMENAAVSLEKDVQEKFSKLFGQTGAEDGEGAGGGEAAQ